MIPRRRRKAKVGERAARERRVALHVRRKDLLVAIADEMADPASSVVRLYAGLLFKELAKHETARDELLPEYMRQVAVCLVHEHRLSLEHFEFIREMDKYVQVGREPTIAQIGYIGAVYRNLTEEASRRASGEIHPGIGTKQRTQS